MATREQFRAYLVGQNETVWRDVYNWSESMPQSVVQMFKAVAPDLLNSLIELNGESLILAGHFIDERLKPQSRFPTAADFISAWEDAMEQWLNEVDNE